MAAVSENIVREYFELQEFLVRQYRKYTAPAGREDDDPDFLVLNPKPEPLPGRLPFELGSADLKHVTRAIVVLKAWHTNVFSPSFLSNTAGLFRFLEKRAFLRAVSEFRDDQGNAPLKILVVPSLPQDSAARNESAGILKSKGIDAAISFRTILTGLVNHVEPNRNYLKSDLLQTLRILKNYDFFKEPQMELFKTARSARRMAKAIARQAGE